MSDETFVKTLIGARDIPYADEDGYSIEQIPRQPRSRLVTKISTDGNKIGTRVAQISRSSRDFVDANSINDTREEIDSRNDNVRTTNQRYAYRERKEDNARSISKTIEQLQKSTKLRTRQQYGREWQPQQQQQQISQGYSSSEESVIRNKSKSTSSADTQSVNNILDEYEDERFVESSDVGSTSTMNFKAAGGMELQQRRQLQQPQQYRQYQYHQQQHQQQQVKQTISSVETRSSGSASRREKLEPVSKVNQQTQVRQRSRERPKEPTRYRVSPVSSSAITTSQRQQRSLILESQAGSVTTSRGNEDLPRRGEVQRRVDEWLSQTQNHAAREKPLTRSNSSAERRSSQRRCRTENPRSRSIDEPADRANGASSSSYDDLTRASLKLEDATNALNLNNNKGTYKDYLAIKGKTRQQDYGFLASNGALLSRSRDISPNTSSRIPQRGSSFSSRRVNETKEKKEEKKIPSGPSGYLEGILSTTSTANVSSSIEPRRPSFKRSFRQDHRNTGDNTSAVGTRSLVKEEPRTRSTTADGTGGGGNIAEGESKGQVAQDDRRLPGDWTTPNKDGESRRCCSAPSSSHDKPQQQQQQQDVVVSCKSNDETTNADRLSKESREIVSGKESSNFDEAKGSLVQVRLPSQGQLDWRRIPARSKPPILPRKESISHASQPAQSPITSHESIQGTKSSFRPNDRNYAKSRLPSVKDNTEFSSSSSTTSSNSTPADRNHVEKIYERSLEPQVIHADDLRSILRPALRISAYGERSDTCEPDESELARKKRLEEEEEDDEDEEDDEEEQIYGRIGETRHETLETILEDDRKTESATRRKDSPILDNDQWNDRRVIVDSANDKTTMTSFRCDEKSREIRYRRYEVPLAGKKNKQEVNHEIERRNEKQRDFEDVDEGAYDLDNRLDKRIDQQDDRFLCNIEEEFNKFNVIDEQTRCRITIDDDRSSLSKENTEDRQGMVIKESLLKNLQFEPSLPTKIERGRTESKAVDQSSRSKRFDDRPELVEKTEEREDDDDGKNVVYVSKEELEHRRLMDMLRRGDYDAVKSVSKVLSFF